MKKQKNRKAILTMFLAFLMVAFFSTIQVSAGPKKPPPPPPPDPVMEKLNQILEKLDQVPPTWSQKLPAAQRFELALDGGAVLDKETGLVWEKSPANTTYGFLGAAYNCIYLNLGGRMGWHLPTISQLMSLMDLSVDGSPKLPAGHPFATECSTGGCVQPSFYWTTNFYLGGGAVWYVNFSDGSVGNFPQDHYGLVYAWCVRGGETYNAY